MFFIGKDYKKVKIQLLESMKVNINTKKREENIVRNDRQVMNNSNLEEKLLGNNCCGQEIILEKVQEKENGKVCLQYTCLKCKKTIFDLQEKPKKKITLTVEQREKLFFYLGSIQQILYEVENNK